MVALPVLVACSKTENVLNDSSEDKENIAPMGVDLGLSVKWATMNVGATCPQEYGDYFAWGETMTKNTYTKSNYSYSDNPVTLPVKDDIATKEWGEKWRMPTIDEWNDLKEKCNWEWVWVTCQKDTVGGYLVSSKINGNSIFLPASGCRYNSSVYGRNSAGHYWSSSLYEKNNIHAYYRHFFSDRLDDKNFYYRYYGQSVRPVCK